MASMLQLLQGHKIRYRLVIPLWLATVEQAYLKTLSPTEIKKRIKSTLIFIFRKQISVKCLQDINLNKKVNQCLNTLPNWSAPDCIISSYPKLSMPLLDL